VWKLFQMCFGINDVMFSAIITIFYWCSSLELAEY